jgi:hypothetical protein
MRIFGVIRIKIIQIQRNFKLIHKRTVAILYIRDAPAVILRTVKKMPLRAATDRALPRQNFRAASRPHRYSSGGRGLKLPGYFIVSPGGKFVDDQDARGSNAPNPTGTFKR